VDLAARLQEEIDTWRHRLDRALDEAEPATDHGDRFLDNIRAYRQDADHFEDEDDLVRAFEAVVWAWAWLEIGADTGEIDWAYPEDWGEGPEAASRGE
jgi:hypothetical protein